MITEEERLNQVISQLTKASNAILLKSFDRTRSYAEVVDDYREIEAEFVARMGDNEFGVLETRRRIAESVLSLVRIYTPSFEICREAWNDLVCLGFTSLFVKCRESWLYGEFCAFDEQPEEGLAVLAPLIAELEQWLEEARAKQRPTAYYEEEFEHLRKLRDELENQRRGQHSPWRVTRTFNEAFQKQYGTKPESKQIGEVYAAIWEAKRAVYRAFARSQGRSFAEIADDYRQLEADIVARASTCFAYKSWAYKLPQYIAQDGLSAACGSEQPLEVCRDAWNELLRVGFSGFRERCRMTRMYAESCGFNGKPEDGLAVLEPLIAELQQQLLAKEVRRKRRLKLRAKRDPLTHEKLSPSFYRDWLKTLGELRDKLSAKQRGNEPST